ncbi:MAG: glucose-6-phosphate dehydrogenase [Deltaproteobacteria bacterium]|nr:glucose-6-phosphate dehydrogenase [Deltaproteobacteria bacterium]
MKKNTIVFLFGATGDLTRRKLIGAFKSLFVKNHLGENPLIVCISRRDLNTREYLESINVDFNSPFGKIFKYVKMDFSNPSSEEIKKILDSFITRTEGNFSQLTYLAVSPDFFINLLGVIKEIDISPEHRIVFEKPFGKNLADAKQLNTEITSIFSEDKIFRIDHYLGKELVQNIFTFRFSNSLFSSIWNREFIDSIQINVSESLGVETRGGYYDGSGATRDMLQNHLLQILSLTMMDPPVSLSSEDIRDAKVKLLNSIKPVEKSDVCFGQYSEGKIDLETVPGYRSEKGVSEYSVTDTYVAWKLEVDNDTWRDVPVFIRTGKRLAVREAEINIILKPPREKILNHLIPDKSNNIITIRIQPSEGIAVRFLAKIPGPEMSLEKAHMQFCHPCHFAFNTMEAYELLLYEALSGDHTLFTRWDFVERSWEIVENLLKYRNIFEKDFPNYSAGSDGPPCADSLTVARGRSWIPLLDFSLTID